MNLKVIWTSRFKKDYKLAIKRNLNIEHLKDYRECHIQPDWLLMYCIEKNILVLTLQRTGTHSDLFAK